MKKMNVPVTRSFNEQQKAFYDLGVVIGRTRKILGKKPLSDKALQSIFDIVINEEDLEEEEEESE